MIIKINNVEYLIKQSLRSLMMFEQLTDKKASQIEDTLTDTITIFYCMLKSNNKNFDYKFEDFIDLIEDDIDAVNQFVEFIKENSKKNSKNEDKKKEVSK